MRIRFTMTGLLSVVMTIAMTSAAFAEEHEGIPQELGRSSGSGICPVERDLVAWGILDDGTFRETRPQTGFPISSLNLRGDGMPPAEYEITAHSFEEWPDDRSAYSESSVTDEVGSVDPTIVFGLKYSFRRFQLDQFRKSILSFMSNGNRSGTAREKAMGFYVDIP